MKLIGLTGKKRAGKDTVAQILSTYVEKPLHFQRIGFADALKQEVRQACGITLRELEQNKEAFRLILQGWGTDFRRNLCSQDYWIDRMSLYMRRDAELIVIPDVRFLNEADFVLKNGGEVWRVERRPVDIDFHISESELDDYEVSAVIDNTSTIEQLKLRVRNAYELFTARHPLA